MRKSKFPENLNDSDHFESCLYYLKMKKSSTEGRELILHFLFLFFVCLCVFKRTIDLRKKKKTPISIRLCFDSVRKEVLFQIEPTNEENRF